MQRLFLVVLGVALCLFVAPQNPAQNSTTAHHHSSAPPMIDGAIHPELIPDSIAYRLYFSAVSVGPNPTDEDRKRQAAHLNKIGLPDLDREILIIVVSDFRTKHDALALQFNQAAEAAMARNETVDHAAFFKQLDELVQATRDALKLRLSREALKRLDAFIQSEKKYMRVPAEGQ